MSDLRSFVLARVGEDESSLTDGPESDARSQRLSECRAMRELVAGCVSRPGGGRDVSTEVLRALALPYASHPDYCDDWRPGQAGDAVPALDRRGFTGRVLR